MCTFCFFNFFGAPPFAGTRFFVSFSGSRAISSTGVSSNQSKNQNEVPRPKPTTPSLIPFASLPSLSSLSLPFRCFPEPVYQSANTSAVAVVSRTSWQ